VFFSFSQPLLLIFTYLTSNFELLERQVTFSYWLRNCTLKFLKIYPNLSFKHFFNYQQGFYLLFWESIQLYQLLNFIGQLNLVAVLIQDQHILNLHSILYLPSSHELYFF